MSFENKGQISPTVIVSQEPDRSGNFVLANSADIAGLQAAVDFVAAGGRGIIYLKPSVDVDGQLVITDVPISIQGLGLVSGDAQSEDLPYIQQIHHHADTTSIWGISYVGFTTHEIIFENSGAGQQNFDNGALRGVGIDKDTTYAGLVWEGSGVSGTEFRNWKVDHCRIHNTSSNGGANPGAVNWKNLATGSSEFKFDSCWFHLGNDDLCVFLMEDDARARNIGVYGDSQLFMGADNSGCALYRSQQRDTTNEGGMFRWNGGRIEVNDNFNIVDIIPDGSNNTLIEFIMSECYIKTDSTLTLFDSNGNTNWAARCWVKFLYNEFPADVGTYVRGTLPNDANVDVQIIGNGPPIHVVNPSDVIANPFLDAASMLVSTGGTAAVPTSGIWYTVKDGPIHVSSQDDGDASLVITLQNVATSNLLESNLNAVQRFNEFTLPRGVQIAWTYTGTAPPVTIYWE